ncbi:MAG: YwbE family protein [Methanoculleus sp.]
MPIVNGGDFPLRPLHPRKLKRDQRSGRRTRDVVAEILTNSSFHPHGIKVRLRDGQVGRVQEIVG